MQQQVEAMGIPPPLHHHHHHHLYKRWATTTSGSNNNGVNTPVAASLQGQVAPTVESARSSPIPPFSAAARLSALGSGSTTASSALYGAGVPRAVVTRRLRSDISEDEKQEIRMAFELFDTRKSGRLSYREVKVAMRALDLDVKKAEVKKLIEEHSRSDLEEVDLDGFMEIMVAKYKEKDPDEEIAKAFRCFDEDGTGKISLKNLRKVARDVGEHITDEELGAMIDEFDKDGDGEISEVEFFSIMKKDELYD